MDCLNVEVQSMTSAESIKSAENILHACHTPSSTSSEYIMTTTRPVAAVVFAGIEGEGSGGGGGGETGVEGEGGGEESVGTSSSSSNVAAHSVERSDSCVCVDMPPIFCENSTDSMTLGFEASETVLEKKESDSQGQDQCHPISIFQAVQQEQPIFLHQQANNGEQKVCCASDVIAERQIDILCPTSVNQNQNQNQTLNGTLSSIPNPYLDNCSTASIDYSVPMLIPVSVQNRSIDTPFSIISGINNDSSYQCDERTRAHLGNINNLSKIGTTVNTSSGFSPSSSGSCGSHISISNISSNINSNSGSGGCRANDQQVADAMSGNLNFGPSSRGQKCGGGGRSGFLLDTNFKRKQIRYPLGSADGIYEKDSELRKDLGTYPSSSFSNSAVTSSFLDNMNGDIDKGQTLFFQNPDGNVGSKVTTISPQKRTKYPPMETNNSTIAVDCIEDVFEGSSSSVEQK